MTLLLCGAGYYRRRSFGDGLYLVWLELLGGRSEVLGRIIAVHELCLHQLWWVLGDMDLSSVVCVFGQGASLVWADGS